MKLNVLSQRQGAIELSKLLLLLLLLLLTCVRCACRCGASADALERVLTGDDSTVSEADQQASRYSSRVETKQTKTNSTVYNYGRKSSG